MGTADELLDQMFSWIEKMESCAEKLRKLARELESLRKICNAGECYGNSVAVVGSACLIGAGVLTLLTGGLAAPVLAGVGAGCTGFGVTITVATKIIEGFISSDTMKDAQKIYENSNDIGEKIQQLFQKLKNEKLKMKPSADPDELDQHVMTELLKAMGRRFGRVVDIILFRDEYQRFSGGSTYSSLNQSFLKPEFMISFTGILAFFTFEAAGKQSKLLFGVGVKEFIKEVSLTGVGTKQLIKEVSSTGFKAFLKGGGLVVGGAVGLVFSLPDAIDSWKDLIKKNNVTEASKSLRDTADRIREMTKTLRKQFDDMKRRLEEEEKRARKEQEKKRARENTTQQHQRDESDREEEESDREEEECDREEEESDREEEESDREEEESDREDEESDSEEEESDSEEQESDREEEDEEKKKKLVVVIKSKPIPPGTINMWLLNTRSMCNKTEEIKNIITENKVDVFNSTETHLKRPDGNQVIEEATPTTHTFIHQMRPVRPTFNVKQERKKKGGGVGIQCDKDLQGERRRTNRNPETFEYVAAEIQHDEWNEPVLSINVYRPPGPSCITMAELVAFLREFKKLLKELSVGYNSIIITGDFNIHVDVDRETTRMFEEFLEDNDLTQHVEGPTHRSGHTLDLVITRNVEIYDLRVRRDIDISDHYPVTFNARPVLEDGNEKTKEKDKEEKVKRVKKTEE